MGKTTTLNYSIGILLRSYTRAINKQNNTKGSLFQAHTKAECITNSNFAKITPSFITNNGICQINTEIAENQYPQNCFKYIHQNPVKAGLVKRDLDWEFSSAKDYSTSRKWNIVNFKSATEYINF